MVTRCFLQQVLGSWRAWGGGVPHLCWDGDRPYFRESLFPDYKKRSGLSEEELEERKQIGEALRALRDSLEQLGLPRMHRRAGLEADDWIAALCEAASPLACQIVSSDADLLQVLLFPNVGILLPHRRKFLHAASFFRLYGIKPSQWPLVKAIAGCRSDGIPGVGGVGEKSAIDWLRGALPEGSKRRGAILRFVASEEGRRNLRLVRLPWENDSSFLSAADRRELFFPSEAAINSCSAGLQRLTGRWNDEQALLWHLFLRGDSLRGIRL